MVVLNSGPWFHSPTLLDPQPPLATRCAAPGTHRSSRQRHQRHFDKTPPCEQTADCRKPQKSRRTHQRGKRHQSPKCAVPRLRFGLVTSRQSPPRGPFMALCFFGPAFMPGSRGVRLFFCSASFTRLPLLGLSHLAPRSPPRRRPVNGSGFTTNLDVPRHAA
jgi:hypothetical protein